jgi:hypothetical protein
VDELIPYVKPPDQVFRIIENPEGDWSEDFHLENGNYMCHCSSCKKYFVGYKHRIQCKKCYTIAKAEWNELPPEVQKEEMRKIGEMAYALLKKFESDNHMF